MSKLNDIIEKGPFFYVGDGATEAAVSKAEAELGLTFADEYRSYLLRFGVAALNGHELTGITAADQGNVVAVTLAERKRSPAAEDSWYVVERANIDDIVLWQDVDGSVFQTIEGERPILTAQSLAEYVEN